MKRMLLLSVAAALAIPALAQDVDNDRRKNAAALFGDGFRAETEKPVNLALAMAKYKKAVEKAKTEMNKEVAAAALARLALCNEKLEPENIGDAKAAWEEVAGSYSDAQARVLLRPVGEIAKEKLANRGIDVWLHQLWVALDPWRNTADRSTLNPLLVEKKTAAWDKIKPMDKDAVDGLVWGLGHPDDVIRTASAEWLAEVVDEGGIAKVIARLNDPSVHARAGASTAFSKIYSKWSDAHAHDRRADELTANLPVLPEGGGRAAGHDAKLKAEIEKARKAAADIRHNIPQNLATADIQGALQKIIEDEAAFSSARREAAGACAMIGKLSGPLVDALVKAMDSKDHNVREACCRAAGAVDTSISADKHKLADKLMKAVTYEPARDENKDQADWHNDEAVRHAAAEALENIALVKTLPALIEALDDNDARVRHAAFHSLNKITRRDFEYEPGKTYEPDKPLAERKKGQAKWEEWWKGTAGIVVLVERFWAFQAQWKNAPPTKLFEPTFFLKEVDSKKWASTDAKADADRAKKILEDFQRQKDVFVQDAVDIGADALEQILKFIGGETEREGNKPNAATRYFVAEAAAKVIEKYNVGNGVELLRNALLSGDNDAKKTGGAIGLGFLPKDKVTGGEREALTRSLAGSNDVKEASANALAKVGDDSSAADLTKTAAEENLAVALASLRALFYTKPKNPDTVRALGDMIADEPAAGGAGSKKSREKYVREYAADALGEIGDPAAIAHLLRARRDDMKNVRDAATLAIQKISKIDAAGASKTCLEVLKDETKKTDDRIGAALSLGDMGDPALGKELSLRIIDPNPPRVLRDPDSGVRSKICEALGNMGDGAKKKTIVENLLRAMGDEGEREGPRDKAYEALKRISGLDPDKEGSADAAKKFKGSDPKPNREGAVKSWVEWFNGAGLSD